MLKVKVANEIDINKHVANAMVNGLKWKIAVSNVQKCLIRKGLRHTATYDG